MHVLTNVIRVIPDGQGRYKRFDVDLKLGTAYSRPGMYVKVGIVSEHVLKSQFCVIMTSTLSATSFLVNATSEFGKTIVEGTQLTVDEPTGGFDISDIDGRSVICFAGGSGIAGVLPIVDALHAVSNVDVIYCESSGQHACVDAFDVFTGVTVHYLKTEGVLSENAHEPILGMLCKLADIQPKVFLNKPVFYACGSTNFVKRLRDAIVPVHAQSCDFRLNF